MKSPLPEPEIVTRNGKAVSVILPIKAYREIMERLEDADAIGRRTATVTHDDRLVENVAVASAGR